LVKISWQGNFDFRQFFKQGILVSIPEAVKIMKQKQLIADLHLHSKYSRAVSRQMVVAEMSRQAGKKGIGFWQQVTGFIRFG